ncbi:hypothetical protein [Stappia stellulata]|uniref:hypothetical protein n=1 Tax=Stappia stellulata TaxID=71235 RepID=UPI00040995B5|nr:hypothetical protein [Stappia stellulata]
MVADKSKQVFSPRDTTLFPLQIEEVRVRQGDTVEAGTVLLTLKTAPGKTLAMRSPLAGTVTQIAAGVGDSLANPRALVILTEADDDMIDGEWEEAADHPSPSPGDTAAESTDRARPDTASDLPPRRDSRNRRGPLVGIAAGLAALALAYPLYGEDLLQALRTTDPSAHTASTKASSASSGTPTAMTRAAETAPYSGPLSKTAMRARDLGDQRQGLTDAQRFVGLGVLRIERGDRNSLDCEAVVVSDRFAAISTICYEPAIAEYGEQDNMRMSFQTLRPIIARNERGERDEVPGLSRLRRLDVEALHVWPGMVGKDGVASIALAEFASAAPGSIGSSGFWRFTKNSAPPVLAFRGVALDDPGRYHRLALNCRYWLAENAETSGNRPLSLGTDPDCARDAGPRRGAIRARHENGKMYFAGFFTSQRRSGKIVRHAVAFSPADTELLRLAKNGDALPDNRMTVRPGKRLEAGGKGLGLRFSNPCDRTIAFHILGSNTMSARQRLLTYKVTAGRATPVEWHLEPAYSRIGIGQRDRGPIPGSRRKTFDGKRLDLVPFKNKSGMELQVTAICD